MEVVPGSIAVLRGSLAHGTPDRYSDIDVLWEVQDEHFTSAVAHIDEALAAVAPVESLRLDPDFQCSEKRRLVYVRFEGVSLFWRLDLDLVARSVGRDDSYDRDNPAARGTAWAPTESALMNVIAAIKAHYRQDEPKGRELLRRGFERVGLTPRTESLSSQAAELTEEIRGLDPAQSALAKRILHLVAEAFPS